MNCPEFLKILKTRSITQKSWEHFSESTTHNWVVTKKGNFALGFFKGEHILQIATLIESCIELFVELK
jgi:hypothetical protein